MLSYSFVVGCYLGNILSVICSSYNVDTGVIFVVYLILSVCIPLVIRKAYKPSAMKIQEKSVILLSSKLF